MTERRIEIIEKQPCCQVNAFEGWTFHDADCENYRGPQTKAGLSAVRLRGLFGGETEERTSKWVADIEAQARQEVANQITERVMKRLASGRRLDLSEAVYFMDEDVEAAIRAEASRE